MFIPCPDAADAQAAEIDPGKGVAYKELSFAAVPVPAAFLIVAAACMAPFMDLRIAMRLPVPGLRGRIAALVL